MAEVFDERFEGTGYEESNWSETLNGGVINEDYATGSVTGAPSNWGTQCLYIDPQGTNNTYATQTLGTTYNISYTRYEVIIEQDNLGAAAYIAIIVGWAGASNIYHVTLVEASGNLYFKYYIDDGYEGASAALSLNTRYRIEIYYNTDNNWEFKLDGASEVSGADGAGAGLDKIDLGMRVQTADNIIVFDNVNINTSTWPGVAPEYGGAAPTGTLFGPFGGPLRGVL